MLWYEILYSVLRESMVFAVPLMLVALGGMFSEKSGVINIALEGIMVIGAFCSIWFINIMQEAYPSFNPHLLLIIAGVIAVIAGMLFSSLLAFSAINLKANQTIGGTALNLMAAPLVIYIARSVKNVRNIQFVKAPFYIDSVPLLGDIPIIGDILFKKVNIMVYIGIVILVVAVIGIDKTRFGLRLSACGEHPQAADSVGINVYKMRWIGVLISGALAGLGGLAYTIASSISFGGDVAGYGFLALAVMIFGQWKPQRILLASLFFGLTKAFAYKYTLFPSLAALPLQYFFNMLPFILTMVVLVLSSKKSRAPKAEGIPYDQGAR
jgi:simple sugar transport system permease protein